jgi:hypothetical protein
VNFTGSGTWILLATSFKPAASGGATVTYPELERLTRGVLRGLVTGGVR